MNVVVDGLLINYQVTGKGKKIILCLHGWADNIQTFDSLTNQLSSDYQIIAVDLPGFGGSELPKVPWDLDSYANFVRSFIGKLGISTYALLGHSNGGAIAIRGLANKALQANKLVLLASAGIRSPGSIRNKCLYILSKPAKLAVMAVPKPAQRRIKQKFYKAIGSDYMISENMRETFRNIISSDVLDDARKLDLPTMLIYGDEDTSTPKEYGILFAAAIPGSELHVIESAGHFVHREQVYKVADFIKGFLA